MSSHKGILRNGSGRGILINGKEGLRERQLKLPKTLRAGIESNSITHPCKNPFVYCYITTIEPRSHEPISRGFCPTVVNKHLFKRLHNASVY